MTKKGMDYTNIHLGMNGDSEKWKLGKFLVKGDRMKNKKKVDSELSLRELKIGINLELGT